MVRLKDIQSVVFAFDWTNSSAFAVVAAATTPQITAVASTKPLKRVMAKTVLELSIAGTVPPQS